MKTAIALAFLGSAVTTLIIPNKAEAAEPTAGTISEQHEIVTPGVTVNLSDSRYIRHRIQFFQDEIATGAYSASSVRSCRNEIAFANGRLATTTTTQPELDGALNDLEKTCGNLTVKDGTFEHELDEAADLGTAQLRVNLIDSRSFRYWIAFYNTEKDKQINGQFVYGSNSRRVCTNAITNAMTFFTNTNVANINLSTNSVVAGRTQPDIATAEQQLLYICGQLQTLDDIQTETHEAEQALTMNLRDSRKLRVDIPMYQQMHDAGEGNGMGFISMLRCQRSIDSARNLFASGNLNTELPISTTQSMIDANSEAMINNCAGMTPPTGAEKDLLDSINFFQGEIDSKNYAYREVRVCQAAIDSAWTILRSPNIIDENDQINNAALTEAKNIIDGECAKLRPLSESEYETHEVAAPDLLNINLRDSRRLRYNIELYQARINSGQYFANTIQQCQTMINNATAAVNNPNTTHEQLMGDNDIEGDLQDNANDNLVFTCERMEMIYIAIGHKLPNNTLNLGAVKGLTTSSLLELHGSTNWNNGYNIKARTIEDDSSLTCTDGNNEKLTPHLTDNTMLLDNTWGHKVSETRPTVFDRPTNILSIIDTYPFSTGGSAHGQVFDASRITPLWFGVRVSADSPPPCNNLQGNMKFIIEMNN